MINHCKKCKSGNIKIDSNYPYHDIYECSDCKYIFHTRIEDCCRKPFEVVTKIQRDHFNIQLVCQCLNCGGADKTKNLKSKDYQEQLRGEFNQWRFEEWKAERTEESNSIYESIKHSNYKNSKKYKYHEYLFSDEWKEKRRMVLTRDNNLCQICKTESAMDIHHLNYDNLFNEPLEDLQSLCRECHFKLHNDEFRKA